MESIEADRKELHMPTPQEPIFDKIQSLYFQVEHNQNQSRNTFNLDEREKFTAKIKTLMDEIDDLLDEYNMRRKFSENINH